MLFICGQSFISGGEFVLKRLLENLPLQPRYLICKDDSKIKDFFTIPSVTIIPCSYFHTLSDLKTKYGPFAYILKVYFIFCFFLFFSKVLAKIKPNVVISNNFSEIPSSVVAYLFKIPFVQYVHEILDADSKSSRAIKLFGFFIQKFICVSKASQAPLLKIIKSENTVIIYNSTDLYPNAKTKDLATDFLSLTYIGMINDNKDPMRFLKWIRILSTKNNVRSKILYHLSNSKLLQECQNYCKEHDLHTEWISNSTQEQIKKCIFESDFICITSQREALSLVALQSLSLGTPVISTENGGVPEIVKDGHSGLVIADDKDLMDKVVPYLSLENYKLLSANCVQDSLKFSHQKMASNFLNAISDSIG